MLYTPFILIVYYIHYTTDGEWISPTVSGDRPPPIAYCTLDVLPGDRSKAVLFGGETIPKENFYQRTNSAYILSLTNDSVVSMNFTYNVLNILIINYYP